ncbi:Microtubule-nucleating Tub4p (gamma-tubulin) complex component [Spiromyces aspiralis]|uniref:Microtubule-nucleating Tub4p (Gamma-tubulin) complex component n=1 Tax=Spiromyces aspiralis TaxID=68401 RepID=A0ACC1HA67_9FUNG|nr:Microtubule-nucleating Tub4p (gamma-tubulin) complex component [Spiromyces aspiralis]
MIPVYMDPEITKKIFLIGKSLSFLRIACGDADWVVEQEAPLQVTERLRNPAALEAFVNPTYERVSRRLMDVLMQRYKLMEHISAMKRYLLLEQGDFFLALIEALGTQMDQPGRTHYRHNLMATVESAIRSSNAQYDSVEYLKRIDVRLPNSREARIGWDTFNLRYNLDHPLSYLVSENTLNYYSKLSFFLLRLKRVEHSLQSLWQRLMVSTRLFHRDDVLGRHGSSPSGEQREAADDARRATIKHSKIACSEMIQFIHQFERYTYLKVIEGAWDTLSKTIRSESAPGSKRNKDIGVDGWISAHNEYITSIYRTLLGKRLNYGNILTRIFETALQFCAHVSEMYDEIIIQNRPAKQHQSNSGDAPRSHIAEFLEQLNNKYRPKAATGGTSRDNSVDHDRQIESTIAKFREQACDLLRVLTEHPDTEMHFLAVSFDFNEYYANGAKGAA